MSDSLNKNENNKNKDLQKEFETQVKSLNGDSLYHMIKENPELNTKDNWVLYIQNQPGCLPFVINEKESFDKETYSKLFKISVDALDNINNNFIISNFIISRGLLDSVPKELQLQIVSNYTKFLGKDIREETNRSINDARRNLRQDFEYNLNNDYRKYRMYHDLNDKYDNLNRFKNDTNYNIEQLESEIKKIKDSNFISKNNLNHELNNSNVIKDLIKKVNILQNPEKESTNNDEIKKIKEDLDNQKDEIKKLKEELDNQKDELNKQKEELDNQKDELNKQKEDLNKQKEKLDNQKDELNKQKEDLNNTKENLNKLKVDSNMEKKENTESLEKSIANKPNVVKSEVETIADKPNVVKTEVETIADKPNVVESEVETIADKPNVVKSEVETIADKPNVVKTEVETIADKPNVVKSEEETIADKPVENDQTKSTQENDQTLRQKFDINNEEDFNKLLTYYSMYNKNYYNGQKKTPEEIRKRRNMNAQFKRILNKKADLMNSKENNPESNFAEKMEQIDNGKLFSDNELQQVSSNKRASLKLYSILANGVYEKDGNRIRLTQKQRIALASTLQKVSEMTLENASKKAVETQKGNDKNKGTADIVKEKGE